MHDLYTRFKTFLACRLGTAKKIGSDSYGNAYYADVKKFKRWVIYKGKPEGSKVPPEWHLWLHHAVAIPSVAPSKEAWQKTHQPNLTGTCYQPRRTSAPKKKHYTSWMPPASSLKDSTL